MLVIAAAAWAAAILRMPVAAMAAAIASPAALINVDERAEAALTPTQWAIPPQCRDVAAAGLDPVLTSHLAHACLLRWKWSSRHGSPDAAGNHSRHSPGKLQGQPGRGNGSTQHHPTNSHNECHLCCSGSPRRFVRSLRFLPIW